MNPQAITALRLQRQCLDKPADEAAYAALYRDLQPGQNVYWNGFGDPPSLTFRAAFDDIAFNRERQRRRQLVKGRFQGGNLGWIVPEDMELFTCLYRKPLTAPTAIQARLLELIEREGPLNIAAMKDLTGLLVKQITPALHRLQEAFLIYEDQYDGSWDRGWFRFGEMFPAVDFARYTRHEALKIVLRRFAYRQVVFVVPMAKAFYRLPARDIQRAVDELAAAGELVACNGGYALAGDIPVLERTAGDIPCGVFVLHRNDFLVKSLEYQLRETYAHPQWNTLYYLLIDGLFRGAVWGHFKNGPYVLEDVTIDAACVPRQQEIIEAVYRVNDPERSPLARFQGLML